MDRTKFVVGVRVFSWEISNSQYTAAPKTIINKYICFVHLCDVGVIYLIVFVVVRMVGMAALVDDRVKTVLLVGGVLDGSQRAVGVVHAVRSLYHVAVPVLVRGLVVAGVRVLDAVLVRVLGVSLRKRTG